MTPVQVGGGGGGEISLFPYQKTEPTWSNEDSKNRIYG